MKIQFIAQSGFIITTEEGIVITIDLWLRNPLFPLEISDVPKTSYVFITHDHSDHDLKTGIELAKRDGSHFISNYDIVRHATESGVQNGASANIGGRYQVGDLVVTQVRADHSSDIGMPVGFIIEVEGVTIYHMGDTAYYAGLDFIGSMYKIDLLMVPIGSRYTMGPVEAAYAVHDLNPRHVIPMHYNTFDKIIQDPGVFAKEVARLSPKTSVEILKPGEAFELEREVLLV